MSRYSRIIDSQDFYVEVESNSFDPEMDYYDYRYNYLLNETLEDFSFKLMTQESQEFYYFTSTKNFLFSDKYINFESKLTSDKIYGFGEKTHDFKLNDGTYTIWNYDCGSKKYDDGKGGMNEYSHQPIGLHRTKFSNIWLGFVFLNSNAQDVIIHSDKNNTYLTHKTIGGIIDYYIIVEDSPEKVVKSIQTLLGIPPLPPFWSFGYHQSRYGYKSFDDFKNVYEKYKSLEIPIDSMFLDIDSFKDNEMFTINDKFKDIIPYVENTIHKDGGKLVPITGLGYSSEDVNNSYIKLGEELDIFIKSNYTKKCLIGKVWGKKTVFPDFLNPNISTFWNKGLEDYHNLINYDGIWINMNEPSNILENSKCIGEIAEESECTKEKNKYNIDELPYIPGYKNNIKDNLSYRSISENALVYGINGSNTIYDTKPLISYYQTMHTYNYFNDSLKKRPFILSRSTSLGSGKYTFHWLGDNLSDYNNLKNSISGIFNFNIFGIPFTGSNICGYMENASKELCIRWYNLGVFYPFSRNHNFLNSKDQYPWSFENKEKYNSIDIIKKNIKIRYSLLRYMYSQFFLISLNEKGSFFKPLMFEFPDDETSYEDIESKIMFGEAFLICAFYEENENNKKIKFPDDNFNYYPNGKTIINAVDEEAEEKEKKEKEKKEKEKKEKEKKKKKKKADEDEDEEDDTNENEEETEKKKIKKLKNNDKNIVELSGKLDQIHMFLRGGFIVPYQNVFDKFILNSLKLRDEKINLILNIYFYKKSKGQLFFDNDEFDTIKNMTYHRVDMSFSERKVSFNHSRNNLTEYNYNDHILGKIEFWRINEIIEIEKKKEKIINLNIIYNDNKTKNEIVKGVYDKDNNKVIFEISKPEKNVSIFDIDEMEFN